MSYSVPSDPVSFGNEGYALMLRFFGRGVPEDLTGAVVAFKKALGSTAVDDVDYYRRALDLSWACETRFDRFGAAGQDYMVVQIDGVERWRGPRDLVLPIHVIEQLLGPDNGRPPGPPDILTRLRRNQANLLTRYALSVRLRPAADQLHDMQRAVSLLEDALREAADDSEDQLTIAASLIAAVEQAHAAEAAGELPAGASAADPLLLERAFEVVATHAGDARLPAPIRIRAQLNRAAELARAADVQRSVAIWRELAGGRSPASAGGPPSPAVPPALAQEAAATWAASALERGAYDEVEAAWRGGTAILLSLQNAQRSWAGRYAVSQRAGSLAAIAALGFARSGSPAQARAALDDGRAMMLTERSRVRAGDEPPSGAGSQPVVYVLAAAGGGLALVSHGAGTERAVPLDGLGDGFLARTQAYAAALDAYRRQVDFGFEEWSLQVSGMVASLGDALGPIVAELPAGPITLVPVGVTAFLPVASALVAASGGDRSIACLPGVGVGGDPSYVEVDQVVVVVDDSLISASLEATGVRSFFPEVPSSPPNGHAPADVLRAIPAGGVAHFACHSEIDVGNPLLGAVILPGGERLTVAQILEADVPAGATIVLSACETGLPDPYGLDEAITLGNAFLALGARGVVSTLWLVEDVSSALLMLRFYWEWRHERHPAPVALALAQRWQRTTSDGAKCAFVESDLRESGVLEEPLAAELAGRIRIPSRSPESNSFAEPYYWAGFQYSGR